MSHSFDTLPPLRDVLAHHELLPKKKLGQNFLLDLNLTSKIARSAGQLAGEHILEIGPGPGGLTRAILKENPAQLTLIERDKRCLPALREIANAFPGKLTIISGDALTCQPEFARSSTRIIANLPYNVATPLLTNWLEIPSWPPFYTSMTLMFQREVAERITATVGTKAYGRLAVLAQWRCTAQLLFDIPAAAFTPPPKVTSAVVHLEPRAEPAPCDLRMLGRVTAAAFGQRRKMLRQSLKSFGGAELCEAVGLEPTIRAEQVPVDGFVRLANAAETFQP